MSFKRGFPSIRARRKPSMWFRRRFVGRALRAVTDRMRSIRHTKIFGLYRYLYVCEQIKENFPTLFIISIFQTLFPFFSVNLSTKEEN